jgi:hypothetical protein
VDLITNDVAPRSSNSAAISASSGTSREPSPRSSTCSTPADVATDQPSPSGQTASTAVRSTRMPSGSIWSHTAGSPTLNGAVTAAGYRITSKSHPLWPIRDELSGRVVPEHVQRDTRELPVTAPQVPVTGSYLPVSGPDLALAPSDDEVTFVGLVGFEPTTPPSQAECADQAAPQPVHGRGCTTYALKLWSRWVFAHVRTLHKECDGPSRSRGHPDQRTHQALRNSTTFRAVPRSSLCPVDFFRDRFGFSSAFASSAGGVTSPG